MTTALTTREGSGIEVERQATPKTLVFVQRTMMRILNDSRKVTHSVNKDVYSKY